MRFNPNLKEASSFYFKIYMTNVLEEENFGWNFEY
jgi:hypothetical protein